MQELGKEGKIWVVDDDHTLQEAIKVILEEEGYEVHTFDNSRELFDTIQKRHPDVILLDAVLGSEDGLQICRSIKNQFGTAVILISANDFKKQEVVNSKADVFIQKPFELNTLITAVESVT